MAETINAEEKNLRIYIPELVERELLSSGERKDYAVFYRDGEEANDYYLSCQEAMALAMELEDSGNDVVVTKLVENEWVSIYESKKRGYEISDILSQ